MKIKKISQIKRFGSFVEFVPNGNLSDFSQYNLIYGWNRTGKTTFSRVFRCFETGQMYTGCPEAEIRLELDNGEKVDQNNLRSRLNIRVFNKDFIEENISWEGDLNTNPIFYLGEENIELNKKINNLSEERDKIDTAYRKASGENKILEDKKERLLSVKAQEVKNTLTTTIYDHYRNYDKRDLENILGKLSQKSSPTEQEFTLLKQKISQESLPKLQALGLPIFDTKNTVQNVSKLLIKSLVIQTIKRLQEDSSINNWVREGLLIHKGRNMFECQFCGQTLPANHLKNLEKHFSNEYDSFLIELASAKQGLNSSKVNIAIPDYNRFYKELQDTYKKASEKLEQSIRLTNSLIDNLATKLTDKENNVFKKINSPFDQNRFEIVIKELLDHIESVNKIIQQHNERTNSFNEAVKEDKQNLETYLATQFYKEFVALGESIVIKEKEVSGLGSALSKINEEIKKLQQDLLSHHIPAKDINKNLQAFFGNNELQVVVNEENKNYQILRYDTVATNLSESEKTTIALVYFLAKIKESNFSLDHGVVVIDDPISSMDSGFIFQSFGFIKTHVKKAEQVFILTHNFDFFRQVKNWFFHVKPRKLANFYMLECQIVNNRRRSVVKPLDKLLMEYESEYHYLFKLIYDYANSADSSLEKAYPFPNLARKFLESFLAFKIPTTDTLHDKMDKLNGVEEEQKTRVLQFVQTHSHQYNSSGLQDMDMNLLGETGDIMKNILDLVRKVDQEHYQYLVNSIVLQKKS